MYNSFVLVHISRVFSAGGRIHIIILNLARMLHNFILTNKNRHKKTRCRIISTLYSVISRWRSFVLILIWMMLKFFFLLRRKFN